MAIRRGQREVDGELNIHNAVLRQNVQKVQYEANAPADICHNVGSRPGTLQCEERREERNPLHLECEVEMDLIASTDEKLRCEKVN